MPRSDHSLTPLHDVAYIPTRTPMRSAAIARLARRAAEFGVARPGGEPAVEMRRFTARTAEMVAGMVELTRNVFAASGMERVIGRGRFVEPRVVEVAGEGGTRRLTATAHRPEPRLARRDPAGAGHVRKRAARPSCSGTPGSRARCAVSASTSRTR